MGRRPARRDPVHKPPRGSWAFLSNGTAPPKAGLPHPKERRNGSGAVASVRQMSEQVHLDTDTTGEQRTIRRWRRGQFLRLGFTLNQAQRLTNAAVDLQETRKLIAAGCPHDLAQRILL